MVRGADPPDPRRGERLDGRRGLGITGTDVALAVPRLLLTPPRLVFGLVGRLAIRIVALDDAHHVLLHLQRLVTSEDGKIGLRPTFAYATGFYPIGGFALFDDRHLGARSHMELGLAAGLPRQLRVDGVLSPSLPRRFHFDVGVHFVRRDDLSFRGVDLASDGGFHPVMLPRARYGIDSIEIPVALGVHLSRHSILRLGESWAWRRYADGRDPAGDFDPITEQYCDHGVSNGCLLHVVDPRLVPGWNTGADFFASDAELVVDSRSARGLLPEDGVRLELGGRYAHGVGADHSSYVHARAALTGAISLGGKSRFLMLRVAAHMLEPFGDGVVPFTELVTLGGVEGLRGFPLDRFRDFSSLLMTAEYRYKIWDFLEMAVFSDVGGVFGKRFSGIAADRFVPDVGVGLRVYTAQAFAMRLQFAYGFGEGPQFSISGSTGL